MRTENSNPKITIIGSGAGAGALVNTLIKNGFDDIDYLINKKDQISAFANKLRY